MACYLDPVCETMPGNRNPTIHDTAQKFGFSLTRMPWDNCTFIEHPELVPHAKHIPTNVAVRHERGVPLYVLRHQNWDELVGHVPASCISLVEPGRDGSNEHASISLSSYLQRFGEFNQHRRINPHVDLLGSHADPMVTVRFQTVFVEEKGSTGICVRTQKDSVFLMGTSQGTSAEHTDHSMRVQPIMPHRSIAPGVFQREWLSSYTRFTPEVNTVGLPGPNTTQTSVLVEIPLRMNTTAETCTDGMATAETVTDGMVTDEMATVETGVSGTAYSVPVVSGMAFSGMATDGIGVSGTAFSVPVVSGMAASSSSATAVGWSPGVGFSTSGTSDTKSLSGSTSASAEAGRTGFVFTPTSATLDDTPIGGFGSVSASEDDSSYKGSWNNFMNSRPGTFRVHRSYPPTGFSFGGDSCLSSRSEYDHGPAWWKPYLTNTAGFETKNRFVHDSHVKLLPSHNYDRDEQKPIVVTLTFYHIVDKGIPSHNDIYQAIAKIFAEHMKCVKTSKPQAQ